MSARRVGLALGALGLVAAGAALAQDFRPRRGFAVTIAEPANQEVALGRTKIAAQVEVDDPALVERVEFLVDGEVVFVDREAPWETFHDFGEASEVHAIEAVAYHREGVAVRDAVITRKIPFAAFERVNRVILWLTATEDGGELVTDLAKEDLRVFEEGREQQVLEFYREDRPITMAILLDTSGSMREKIEEVHEAAGAFVDTLNEEDRALVIDFDDRVFLIQELTSDREALKAAIRSTEPLGATAVYDAMHAAYRKIGTIDGRKAIILLSDGEDTSSQFAFKRVLEEAKASDALVYGISIGEGDRSVLRDFAEATGGRAFHVRRAEDLAGVYQRIAEELRAQYYLTYSTTNETFDGRWVELRVESARPGVDVRARSGYFAVRSGPS